MIVENGGELRAHARQLVVFCDGTNNTLTGRQSDTNVLRVFEHLSRCDDERQILYYDPGVGSPDALPSTGFTDWFSRKWERIFGLASGRGIYENIGEAYAFLIRTWQPGDEIWVYGFSRGAFTARCVAGMVNLFGIIRPEHESLLPTLLRVYFAPSGSEARDRSIQRRVMTSQTLLGIQVNEKDVGQRETVADQVRDSFTTDQGRDAGVHFIGVWDTVESVGLPGFSLKISSVATVRDKRFAHVRHALALDEHRRPFLPRLYSENNFGSPRDPQSLVQLWFRGVHGDSGGGYAPEDSELSNAALRWMVDESIACGLRCPEIELPPAGVLIHDPIHDMPWWTIVGLTLRDSTKGDRQPDGSYTRVRPVAHPSVAHLTPDAKSVWQNRQPVAPLFVAGIVIVAGLVIYGQILLGPSGGISGLASIVDGIGQSLAATGDLASAQLKMLWAVPTGHWRAEWAMAPHHGGLKKLFVLDLLLIGAYTFLISRVISPGFTRLAGLRTVGDGLPGWYRLGGSLGLMLAGDVTENLSTMWALSIDGSNWQCVPLFFAGIGALGKWAGIVGCSVLAVMGWFARPASGSRT